MAPSPSGEGALSWDPVPLYGAPLPTQAPGTNGWAVAALVTGLLGLVPVAVGAGITGVVQTRRRPQGGLGLAVAGLVLGGLWTVGLTVLLVVGLVTGGGSAQDSVLGRVADAGSTAVGTCLLAPDGNSTSTPVDCGLTHDAQVYRVRSLGEGAYPGQDRLVTRADDDCYGAFREAVGQDYDTSPYDYGLFLPDEAEWVAGEHRVVCVVLPSDQDTLESDVLTGQPSDSSA